jgi:phage shock protein PspC (stress-responsive transcriptional regulator)
MSEKKLYRNTQNAAIAGVAAGLADFFNMDVAVMRIIFVLITFFGGGGLVIYIVLWIFIPPKPVVPQADIQAEVVNPEPEKDEKLERNRKIGGIAGGIILILLGILFLVDIYTCINFRDLWPLLVIALGVVVIIGGVGFTKKK